MRRGVARRPETTPEAERPGADGRQGPGAREETTTATAQEAEPKTFDEAVRPRSCGREASELRTRANEVEAKLKEIDDRDKSEQERLAEKRAAAEKRAEARPS